MLTGRSPFAADTLAATLTALLSSEPAPIPAGSAPPAIAGVIYRALAKSPAERHQSSAAMRAALREALDDRGGRGLWRRLAGLVGLVRL